MASLPLTARRDAVGIATSRFARDFGLDLCASPFGREVQDAFQRMAEHSDLSRDASTALLYRMFVQRALATNAHDAAPDPGALLQALDALLARSAVYSEEAPDHLAFEAVTGPMNAWIARRLAEVSVLGHA